jgi:hypothetical protein
MIATPGGKPNVFYLPAAEPLEAAEPLPRWARVRNRVLSGWWQARLSLADLRAGARGENDYSALLRNIVEESPAELIDRRRPKPSATAKVIDFEAARLRLRPATS